MIATPHIGAVDPQWFGAFLRLGKPEAADGSAQWFRTSSYRLEIAAARNMLALMLANPTHPGIRRAPGVPPSSLELGATHLLFWDDDVIPPPDGLYRLLAHDVDIVSGFYTTRHAPVTPVAFRLTEGGSYQSIEEFHDGLQEVDGIGAGFVLIKRRVFEQMEPPWFQFICTPDVRRNISEDLYFCRMAQQAGFRIHLDFDVQCQHIGQHIYDLSDCIVEDDVSPITPDPAPASGTLDGIRARTRRRKYDAIEVK